MIAKFRYLVMEMIAQTKTKKGFTLLELMVVIVIIGILAAVAVPIILNAQRDSRDSRRQTQLEAIRIAAAKVITAKGGNTVRVSTTNNCTSAPTTAPSGSNEINTYYVCAASTTSNAETVRLTDSFYLVQGSNCNNITNMNEKAIHYFIQTGSSTSTGKFVLCKEGGSTQELEFNQQ